MFQVRFSLSHLSSEGTHYWAQIPNGTLYTRTIHPSMDRWIHGSIDLWIYGSIDLSIYIYLSIYLFIYLLTSILTPLMT